MKLAMPTGRAGRMLRWIAPPVLLLLLLLVLWPGVGRFREADEDPAAAQWGEAFDPADAWESAALDAEASGALVPLEPLDRRATRDLDAYGEPGAEGTELACIIEPFQVVDIGSSVTGLIERVHVERSDLVEHGQVLVELEAEAERAAVEVAREKAEMDEAIRAREATFSLGQRKRKRVNKLFEGDALSLDLREEAETEAEIARLELERARAEKQLASLQLDQARALLKRRTIRSPISGVVVERLMSPGERVDEETILRVAQVDPLRVEVILPSSLFGTVRQGMRAAVTPEFPGDEVHVATVSIVDRLVDAASGTFGVRLELPNSDHAIPGGLHCQVRFLDE